MELKQIKYFLALAETLNFTKAAQQCDVSQPSLTKSIQRLEEELGGPLLYRDGKDSRLSALGRDVQVQFMKISHTVMDVKELAENSVRGRHRTLNLGVENTISPNLIARFINHALRQLPTIEIELHSLGRGEGVDQILAGTFDACFLSGQPKENFKLATQTLYEEPIKLACAASHPLAAHAEISPKDMAEQDYVDRLNCEFRTQVVEHFMNHEVLMKPRFSSDREDWVQQVVASGDAVCIMPERSVVDPNVVTRPVSGLGLSREIVYVTISGSGSPMELRQISEMAKRFDWATI